jgi:hypothetical protein
MDLNLEDDEGENVPLVPTITRENEPPPIPAAAMSRPVCGSTTHQFCACVGIARGVIDVSMSDSG